MLPVHLCHRRPSTAPRGQSWGADSRDFLILTVGGGWPGEVSRAELMGQVQAVTPQLPAGVLSVCFLCVLLFALPESSRVHLPGAQDREGHC